MKDDARFNVNTNVAYQVDESEIEAPNALIQDDLGAFIYNVKFDSEFYGDYHDEF